MKVLRVYELQPVLKNRGFFLITENYIKLEADVKSENHISMLTIATDKTARFEL